MSITGLSKLISPLHDLYGYTEIERKEIELRKRLYEDEFKSNINTTTSKQNSSSTSAASGSAYIDTDDHGPIEPKEKLSRRTLLFKKQKKNRQGKSEIFEIDDEKKEQWEALRLRSALYKDHKFKRNTMQKTPKMLQIGKVLDNPADFYSSRVPKRKRKNNIAEEMFDEAKSLGLNF